MRNLPWSCLSGVLLLAGNGAAAGDSVATFAQIARPHPRSPGAPRAADVCFSTRWPRVGGPGDSRDSFQAAQAFHATRLDWLYLSGKPGFDKEFVAKFQAEGYRVGGTLNCQPTDSPVGAERGFSIARTVNMKGEPLKDPWTRKYGGRFCCPNHPDYAKIYLAHARYALDAGIDHFQMDGPELNDIMLSFGGCFCPHCVRGFREYLAGHSTPQQRAGWGIENPETFDYARFLLDLGTTPDANLSAWKGPKDLRELFRQFQIESGLRFLGEMHRQIDQMAGRKLAYSCNATRDFLTTYHRVFEFALNESYPATEGEPAFLSSQRLEKARQLGKSMLFTFVSDDVTHNRRFIASAYALGANAIVPWDVFTGLDTPRFFGTPEQFADLFGFVRANAALLEGYEEAGLCGLNLRDSRFAQGQEPLQVCAASPVMAVVRAKPGEANAPVVIHLVAATNDKTGPVRLAFDPRRFFGERPLRLRFLTPAPYARVEHEKAESTHDFGPLVRTSELPGGRVSLVDLPAVEPWGMLVVEPGEGPDDAPWQPAVWCDPQSRFRDTLAVRLNCVTAGATVRYTLDGAEPAETSPCYREPLELSASVTLKARAFAAPGKASPVAAVRFERSKGRRSLSPDAASLKANLKLWLRGDSLAASVKDGQAVSNWPAVVGPESTVPKLKLLSGAAAGAPSFGATAMNGHPGIRFDGVDDQLSIRGFAKECLAGKPFTVFLVTQSTDPLFGVCGNAANGSGGVPRLYLTRGTFCYDRAADPVPAGAAPGATTITVYQHDGSNTASARSGGRATGQRADMPLVREFGSGGNLAIPFWSGHESHAGDLGEVIVFDRLLSEAEVAAVEEELSSRYGTGMHPRWN